MLAAGLLMGAGSAVAVADPDSSGSTTNSTDTNQKDSTGAENPKKDGTDANGEKTKGEKKDSDLAAAVDDGQFVIAGGQASPLFGGVESAFDDVAALVVCGIECRSSACCRLKFCL